MTDIFNEIKEEYKKEKYKTVEKIYEANKKELSEISLEASITDINRYVELFTLISSTYFFLEEEEKAINILTKIIKLYKIKKTKIQYDDEKYLFYKEIYESLMLMIYYFVKTKNFDVAKNLYLEAFEISSENYIYNYNIANEIEIEKWKEILIDNTIKITRIDININKNYEDAKQYLDSLKENISDIGVEQNIIIFDFYVTIYKNINNKNMYLSSLKNLNSYLINNLNKNNIHNHFELYINKITEFAQFLDDNDIKKLKDKNMEVLNLISKDDELKNNTLYKKFIN